LKRNEFYKGLKLLAYSVIGGIITILGLLIVSLLLETLFGYSTITKIIGYFIITFFILFLGLIVYGIYTTARGIFGNTIGKIIGIILAMFYIFVLIAKFLVP